MIIRNVASDFINRSDARALWCFFIGASQKLKYVTLHAVKRRCGSPAVINGSM